MQKKFITPVSMQVTKEQYEKDLKQSLLTLGYTIINISTWDNHFILCTNYNTNHGVSNLLPIDKGNRGRHFIDHYNPQLFLALAAMTEGELPIVGEYVIGISSLIVSRTVPSKVTSIHQKNPEAYSTNNQGSEKVAKTSVYYNRKATKEELINHFSKQQDIPQEKKIIGYRVIKAYPGTSVNTELYYNEEDKEYHTKEPDAKGYFAVQYPQDIESNPDYFTPIYEDDFKVGEYIKVQYTGTFYTTHTIGNKYSNYARNRLPKIGDVGTILEKVQDNMWAIEINCKTYLTDLENVNSNGPALVKATAEEVKAAQTQVFDMGTFDVKVIAGKAYHRDEDISNYVRSLTNTFINFMTKRSFGNYDCNPEDVIFSKTGCQSSPTKLSDWIKVAKALGPPF